MGSANPIKIGRFCLHPFRTLTSTQVEARDRHYHAGDIIIADTQTMGYGRRGRVWQSPPGNLYCTMVEHWQGYEQLNWLPYAVGLALYDGICELLSHPLELRLKWPNDLLLSGAKLSGVLLEVVDDMILIGIGMNIGYLPETDQQVTTLNAHLSTPIMPIDVIKRFLPAYESWSAQAAENRFATLRTAWLSRAAFKNEVISARLADGRILTGIFRDINDQGALVLQDESSHHSVTTADIYLRKEHSS